MTQKSLAPTDMDYLSAALHTPEPDASDAGVEKLLKHDALGKVEELTGSYRDKPALGLAHHMMLGARKDHVLKERGDTTFSMGEAQYISALVDYGFELLLSEKVSVTNNYRDPGPDNEPRDEAWYLYVKEDDGLFLYMDTHHGQRNAAKVYYKWRPSPALRNAEYSRYNPVPTPHDFTSSGHYEGNVWVGDHDAREALFYHMDRLRDNGTFIRSSKTIRPRLWFISYWETPRDYEHGFDYEAITEAKIAQLPKKYQKMLGR